MRERDRGPVSDWRQLAVDVLRKHGRLTPEQLGDLTGHHRNAVVLRVKKFPNYFKAIEGTQNHNLNRDRIVAVELVDALRVA